MARNSRARKAAPQAEAPLPPPERAGAPEELDSPPPRGGLVQLVRVARENPYHFFTLWEVGKICGLGRDVMTALNSLGAPVVGRRCNPRLLLEWIGQNPDKIGKIR